MFKYYCPQFLPYCPFPEILIHFVSSFLYTKRSCTDFINIFNNFEDYYEIAYLLDTVLMLGNKDVCLSCYNIQVPIFKSILDQDYPFYSYPFKSYFKN